MIRKTRRHAAPERRTQPHSFVNPEKYTQPRSTKSALRQLSTMAATGPDVSPLAKLAGARNTVAVQFEFLFSN
jgi:hypothetical protein